LWTHPPPPTPSRLAESQIKDRSNRRPSPGGYDYRRKRFTEGGKGNGLSRQQAYALCDETLRIANRGKVPTSDVKFRKSLKEEERAVALDGMMVFDGIATIKQADGTVRRFGQVHHSGSGSISIIFDLEEAKRHKDLSKFLEVQKEPGDFTDDYLLSISDQPVIVSANFGPSKTNVERISSFMGKAQTLLCKPMPNGKTTIKALDADVPEPCRAVIEQKARFARWTAVPYRQGERIKFLGDEPDSSYFTDAVMDIDLDNDGVMEKVGLRSSDNSTGSGPSRKLWLGQIDQGDGAGQKEIFKALRKVRWEALFPLLGPQNDVNIFTHSGRTYFFGQIDWQAGVFTMAGDKLQRVCRLDVLPQQEIVESYINW
jgi:hypothetical protein